MTSWVFHACRIPEECVRVTFFLISSSLRPLHSVAFYNILNSDFLSRGTYFTRSKLFSRVYHACKIFLLIYVRGCVIVVDIPLPRLAFSYVTQLRFQSTDAWSRSLLNDLPGVPRV